MKLKKIVTLMSMSLFVTGCAEMHSEQYKATKTSTEHNIDNVSKLRESAVDKVIAGTTLKDFFVDVNPVKIRVNDVLKLPARYPESVRFYSALPETENQLASRLESDYGIKIKFSRLIDDKDKDDSKKDDEDSDQSTSDNPTMQNKAGDNVTADISNPSENADSNDSDYTSAPQGIKDGMAVFGMALEKPDQKLVAPIDYDGNVEGLMKLIAADRGLDWKYDADNDVFVFYDLDTETFSLIDNSGETDISFGMQTSAAGDGKGVASNTNLQTSNRTKYNNWDSVMDIVKSLVGENGKVSGNQSLGQIVVTDTKENLARVKKVIDTTNAQSGIQVVMGVTFLKFSLNKSSSFGTNLSNLSASDIVGKAVGISGNSGTLNPDGLTGSLYKINFNKAGVTSMIHALSKLGTINYRFSADIISMNNQLMPYQKSIDGVYISGVQVDKDDNGVTRTPITAIRKTGITSTWLPRVIGDRVKINGHITMSRALGETKNSEFGITLPTDSVVNESVDSIIANGKTRIVAIKEVSESKADSSGVGSVNTLPLGGTEDTSTTREVSLILMTPYIVKQ